MRGNAPSRPRPRTPPPDTNWRDLPEHSLCPKPSHRSPAKPYLGPHLSRGGHFMDQLLGPLLLWFTVGRILSWSCSSRGNRTGPSDSSSSEALRVVLASGPGILSDSCRDTAVPQGLWSAAGLCLKVWALPLASTIFRDPLCAAPWTRDPGSQASPA